MVYDCHWEMCGLFLSSLPSVVSEDPLSRVHTVVPAASFTPLSAIDGLVGFGMGPDIKTFLGAALGRKRPQDHRTSGESCLDVSTVPQLFAASTCRPHPQAGCLFLRSLGLIGQSCLMSLLSHFSVALSPRAETLPRCHPEQRIIPRYLISSGLLIPQMLECPSQSQ